MRLQADCTPACRAKTRAVVGSSHEVHNCFLEHAVLQVLGAVCSNAAAHTMVRKSTLQALLLYVALAHGLDDEVPTFSEQLEVQLEAGTGAVLGVHAMLSASHSGLIHAEQALVLVSGQGRTSLSPAWAGVGGELGPHLPPGTSLVLPTLSRPAAASSRSSWCRAVVKAVNEAAKLDRRLASVTHLGACGSTQQVGGADFIQGVPRAVALGATELSGLGNGTGFHSPWVLGADAIQRLLASASACAGLTGIPSSLSPASLASSAWWRLQLHLRPHELPGGGLAWGMSLHVWAAGPWLRPAGPAFELEGQRSVRPPDFIMSPFHSHVQVFGVERPADSALAAAREQGFDAPWPVLHRQVDATLCDELMRAFNLPSSKLRGDFPSCWAPACPEAALHTTVLQSSDVTGQGASIKVGQSARWTDFRQGLLLVSVSAHCPPSSPNATIMLEQTFPAWSSPVVSGVVCQGSTLCQASQAPGFEEEWPLRLSIRAGFPLLAGSPSQVSVQVPVSLLRQSPGAAYPSDAHRGRAFPPVFARLQCGIQAGSVRTWASGALMEGPVPDFSMPYNVEVISTSILAFVIGSWVNVCIRAARLHASTMRGRQDSKATAE